MHLLVAVLAALRPPPMLDRAAAACKTPSCNGQHALKVSLDRRGFLTAAGTCLAGLPQVVAASDALAVLRDNEFYYQLTYPADWNPAPKPVKTHLHEALLSASSGRGVKLGITVDPVKIDSLEAFGSLDQVTERVLGVEKGRDGVTKVDLRAKASEAADGTGRPSYYTIEYATDSSRGRKIFCCKYCITDRKLYVLQVQAKLDAFDDDEALRTELRAVTCSFQAGRGAVVASTA